MSADRITQNVLVLMTQRDRLEKCKDFEEFKQVQCALLDYLIEDQLAMQKSEEAFKKFVETTS
jgi:hypothetical protein